MFAMTLKGEFMNVQFSNYLTSAKPVLKTLLDELLKKYSYASILASDSFGKTYRVSKSGTVISTAAFTLERGFVAKIFDGNSYCEYSFSFIDLDSIPEILATIETSLLPLKDSLPAGLSYNTYGQLTEEPLCFSKTSQFELDPVAYGDQAIIDELQSIFDKGISYDERIINFSAGYEYCQINKMFLSKDKDLEQGYLWSIGNIAAFASKGEAVKYYGKSASKQCGVELLSTLKDNVELVVKTALELLDCQPLTPGEYDCICDPDVSGLIAHEAFGHGVEMDMFVKKRALAESYLNEYVASELVTMHDSSSVGDSTGSFFFDDEGTVAQDTVIIDRGVLVKGMNDLQTAMTLNVPPTGNGRRQRFDHKTYTRMTNTYFAPGTSTLEEMIASIKDGYILEGGMSGMEDPKNWGIQCMVNIAREIKDGKLTGKIYSPVILTGYVPDLLKSISMVSKDLELFGSGGCGKGYKEWVKVSTGGPYIKAKVRLG